VDNLWITLRSGGRNHTKIVENKIQPNMLELSKLSPRVAEFCRVIFVARFSTYGLFWESDLTPTHLSRIFNRLLGLEVGRDFTFDDVSHCKAINRVNSTYVNLTPALGVITND
jgi:hypothetical protein